MQNGPHCEFREAECYEIDASKKKVFCRSTNKASNLGCKEEFSIDYDYLIVSVGARSNTFNTPGVEENALFLKVTSSIEFICYEISSSRILTFLYIQEVEDAQKIRQTVIHCFERASLPTVSEEDKRRMLHFVVVGGGPTGVEFAAELHDFANEDLARLYPSVKDLVKITLLEAGDHILNM